VNIAGVTFPDLSMTKHYTTINQYFNSEPHVSVQALQLNGLLVSALEESSNDISIASTKLHSVLLSVTGSRHHHVRICDKVQKSPTQPGYVSLIPSGVNLQSSWRTTGPLLRTISLEFNSDLFRIFAPEIFSDRCSRGHVIPSIYSSRVELASLTMLLKRELDESVRMGALFSDGVIRLLALEIAANGWSEPSVMPNYRDLPDPRVSRAIDYIEENFHHDISLVSIANASGLSLTQFTRQFRSKTGMTPYSYVIDRRLRLADRLLKTTSMPIVQVALEAGFADQQHLTRVVRSRKGQTPRMIRMGDVG
jgi:AraC family transcriptional regulator